MCDWFSWKILNSCLNGLRGRYYVFCSGRRWGWMGWGRGGDGGGFDILSLISCFSAAWRLTLMHWKDGVLTAHQHIRVRSPLAQESSGLRVIHSEKMKCKWVCPAVLRVSHFEKENKVMAKGIGKDNESGGERGRGKCMGVGFLYW